MASVGDQDFRDSVIHSDLVIADGMSVVLMARFLGVPIYERVAGSSLMEAIQQDDQSAPMRVFLFGGPDGVAEAASKKLTETAGGIVCAGFYSPGFVSVDEMSRDETIAQINASGADFLLVALGASKGQVWIERNRTRLSVPVVSHLGAVINFLAGTVRRAPMWVQRCGLEWVWRIKEEPTLWRRYWRDGGLFARVLVRQLLPHVWWKWRNAKDFRKGGWVQSQIEDIACRLRVIGYVDVISPAVRAAFRGCGEAGKPVVLDVSETQYIGPGFFGMVLLLKKQLDRAGLTLQVIGINQVNRRFFCWNGVEYLLESAKP